MLLVELHTGVLVPELAELGRESIGKLGAGRFLVPLCFRIEGGEDEILGPAAALETAEALTPLLGGKDGAAELAPGQLLACRTDHESELVLDPIEKEPGQISIIAKVDLLLFAADLVKRWLGDEKMSTLDKLPHLSIEEGQQQSADVRTVDVRIGHDDDLVVPHLERVELLLADAGAEAQDERPDFLRREHPVESRLFDVEDLATERQNGLKEPVPTLFCRAARGITLYDEELGQLRVTLGAIRELAGQSRGFQRAFAPGELARLAGRLSCRRRVVTF